MLWKVTQSPKYSPIWSHCLPPHFCLLPLCWCLCLIVVQRLGSSVTRLLFKDLEAVWRDCGMKVSKFFPWRGYKLATALFAYKLSILKLTQSSHLKFKKTATFCLKSPKLVSLLACVIFCLPSIDVSILSCLFSCDKSNAAIVVPTYFLLEYT